jgi:hypothetical protein
VGVTECRDSNTGQRIQIFLTLSIDNPVTLSVAKGHRQPSVGIHDMGHEQTSKNKTAAIAAGTAANKTEFNSRKGCRNPNVK